MTSAQSIRFRLADNDEFSLAEVREWMNDQSDLATWQAVDELLQHHLDLIMPVPPTQESCAFIARFLIRCIHENHEVVHDDDPPSGCEAGHQLAHLLKSCASDGPDADVFLANASEQITAAYLKADKVERNRIETGFLEHALEARSVRPYFDHWKEPSSIGGRLEAFNAMGR